MNDLFNQFNLIFVGFLDLCFIIAYILGLLDIIKEKRKERKL